MKKILRFLDDTKGTKIKLHFYCPPHTGSMRESAYTWTGWVEEIETDSIEGGYIKFHHDSMNAKRMQLDISYLNLEAAVIWGIDIIRVDYEEEKTYIECPTCKQMLNLQAVELLGEDDVEDIEEEKTEEEPETKAKK